MIIGMPKLGPYIQAAPLEVTRFTYTNWRGVNHVYEVDVESFQFGPFTKDGTDSSAPVESHRWVMHGYVVTRDGDDRPEMGDNRRRTFLLDGISNMERID